MIYLGKNPVGITNNTGEIYVECGTYKPEEDVRSSAVLIPHSLGVVPDFVSVTASDFFTASGSSYIICSMAEKGYNNSGISKTIVFYKMTNRNTWEIEVDNAKFFKVNGFYIPYYNTADLLKGGTTYNYVVGLINPLNKGGDQ